MSNHQIVSDQEESEKCLRIAQKHLLQDDHQTALHYLYKSQQIFPSTYVKGMIDKVEQLIKVSEENGRYEKDKRIWEGIDLTSPHIGDSGHEGGCEKKGDYTEDQLEAIKKINESRDYYEVLGIQRDASEQEMKRQYRKLALQYHPDKNSTPGAVDVFKMINCAFDTLSDPQKRRYYDLYGRHSLERLSRKQEEFGNEAFGSYYSPGYDSGLPPEEIFHMFFGSRSSRSHDSHRNWCEDSDAFTDQREDCQRSGLSVLLQIMPVIVFVCVSIISSYLMSDSVYSLSRNSKFQFLRKTSDLNIPYFVKENFDRDYRHNLNKIEEEVNQEYVHDLTVKCFRERNYRENLIRKAKNIGDSKFELQARNLKTPSCSELQEVQKRMDDT